MHFGLPLTALSVNTLSSFFARQLVVPTLPESAGMSVTGVVGIIPVPTAQSDSVTGPYLTMGHGPVVVSATSTLDHQWTIGHGPAMSSPTAVPPWATHRGPVIPEPTSPLSLVQVTTKAAPPPASTFATVVMRSPAALNTSGVTCRPLVPANFLDDFLGCHPMDDDWIYFTLVKSDDSLALSRRGIRILYFVSKEWTLTYPNKVRKALFNDPSSYPTCPEGHCRSTLIPKTEIRLSLVKRPKVFRSGGYEDSCGYVDDVHTVRKNLVTRAEFGYLNNGVTVSDAVIAFVEKQVLTTYPTLEIGLIAAFTVGVFVIIPFMVVFLACSYYYCGWAIAERAKECGQAVAAGVCAGFNKLRETGEKIETSESRSQLPGPLPHQNYGYARVPPPAYSTV